MTAIFALDPADPRPPDAAGGPLIDGPLIPPLSRSDLVRHAPNVHLVSVGGDGVVRARASLWWTGVAGLPPERPGVVGHYAASDQASGVGLLDHCCLVLGQAGCTMAIGPMDGSTWRSYRFVVERGPEPPFFLEPDHPAEWPVHFTRAGFTTLATYTSALADDLDQVDERVAGAEARLAAEGVTIRSWDPATADRDLRRIHQLSLDSFRKNFLYTPLGEEEFMEQHRRLLPFVLPDLVLLAERGDDLVGFLFGLPDALRRQRGGVLDTVIIKTVAVRPASACAGLGSVLVATAHRRARQRGFTRAIHALMHEENVSTNISRRYAKTIRRYALLARSLTPSKADA